VSDIEWFDKSPGDGNMLSKPTGDGDHMLLIQDSHVGNLVRLPPELGGMQLRVLEEFTAPCPAGPRTGEPCTHLKLENGYYVAELDQFYWYKKKEE
jgi:hypothetical protein